MKIKQLIPISNEYAVLATDDYDYKHICYDRKLDDVHFFWAVLDGGEYEHDAIALIQVSEDGSYEICERNLVVERQVCPICGQKMFPKHSEKHNPTSWQDCAGCGYRLDTSYDAKDTAGSRIQEIIRGREEDDA